MTVDGGRAAERKHPLRSAQQPTAPLLDLIEVSKTYSDGSRALSGVSVQVRRSEVVAVLGANGSGKSTQLRCAVGLVPVSGGNVRVAGRDMVGLAGRNLRATRRGAAVIFQRAHLVRRRSALANVVSGTLGHHPGLRTGVGLLPPAEHDRGVALLRRVGAEDLAERRADTLSGGQAQRVAIARALAQEPAVILADEPVAGLDPEAVAGVMGLLAALAREGGLGVLCVLHQPDLARDFADRTVALRDGRIAYQGRSDAVPPSLLDELYRAAERNG